MAYIPQDAEWYLADLVVEIRVESDPRCVIHINTVLVNARSSNEAFEKSIVLGEAQVGAAYLNPAGKRVESRFLGLKDLSVIHEKLAHGAELFFAEFTNLSLEEISSLIQSKEKLSVFSDVEATSGPDYSSAQIATDYKNSKKI